MIPFSDQEPPVLQTQVTQLQPSRKNLNSTYALLTWIWRHKWVSAIVLLLVSALLFVMITPDEVIPDLPPPLIAPNSIQPSSIRSVVFTGSNPNLPDSFTIYRGDTTPISVDAFMQELASDLSLDAVEGSVRFYQNAALASTLTYNEAQKIVTFQRRQNDYPVENAPPIDIERIVAQAQQFIHNELGFPQYVPNVTGIGFYGEESEVTAATAEFIEVPFSYTIDGYPVAVSNSSLPPATATVNRNNEVFRVDVYVPLPFPKAILQAKPVSVDTALDQIRKNNASILSSSLKSGGIIELERIDTLSFSKVELQYRFDTANNVYYPYYVFTGEAKTNRADEAYEVVVGTPAILTVPTSN